MPTEAHGGLLDRDFCDVAAKPITDIACPLLCEVVNYSTNVLVRCDYSSDGDTDVDVAVVSLFRAAIAILDGIHVLVSKCCVEPSNTLVRSLFEHMLNIEYILRSEIDYRDRSLAWTGFRLYERIRYLEQLLPDTIRGRELERLRQQDVVAKDVIFSASEDMIRREIDNDASILQLPHFLRIAEEIEKGRLIKGKDRFIKYTAWYQLFDGPLTIRDLATSLNRGAMYALLYSGWSRYTHGTDLLAYKLAGNDAVFNPLRYTSGIRHVVSFSVIFLIQAIELLLAKFRPGDDEWRSWYKREIRGPLSQIERMP